MAWIHCTFRSDTNHYYQRLVNSKLSFHVYWPRKLKTFEAVTWPPPIARKPRTDARFTANALLFSVVGNARLVSCDGQLSFCTVAHICKHNKQFLKHNTIFVKHKSTFVKHNTKLSKHNTKLSKHNTKTKYWRTARVSLGTRAWKRGGCPIWRWRWFAEMFVSKGKSYSWS